MKKIQLLGITVLFGMVSFFPTHAFDKSPACKECKISFKAAKKACKGKKGPERSSWKLQRKPSRNVGQITVTPATDNRSDEVRVRLRFNRWQPKDRPLVDSPKPVTSQQVVHI